MCHPFRPFNLNTGQEMEILEIPLAIMDQTLLSYMQLNMEQAWNRQSASSIPSNGIMG